MSNMKKLNEAERMILEAAKDYLLAYQGNLVGPKEMYMARYKGLRDMAMALGAITQSSLEEIIKQARKETGFAE